MAILFFIVGISLLGLSGLFLTKLLEDRGSAPILPTLRRHADRFAVSIVAQARRIEAYARSERVKEYTARLRPILLDLGKQAWAILKMVAMRVRAGLRALMVILRRGSSQLPLAKGAVSLYLQRLSIKKGGVREQEDEAQIDAVSDEIPPSPDAA